LSVFVNTAVSVPLYQLPAHLFSFPPRWPFPRGDLYHWIPLLNRFDRILELFNQEYGLKDNVQTRPFGRQLLVKGDGEAGQAHGTSSEEELEAMGYDKEGDRELVETVLIFSRMLLENCGNRSLYSSSGHLNDILNTTSLSLLNCTLRLGVRLAQRYHASRQRTVGATSHINSALLLSHYNINLDKIQKLAAPFVKSLPPAEPAQPLSPVTPGKGKEKATTGGTGSSGRSTSVIPIHATDLVALAKGVPVPVSSNAGEGADEKKPAKVGDAGWEEWGGVWFSYYLNTGDTKKPTVHGTSAGPVPQIPATPTPSRRSTGLGQHQAPRHSRLSSLEDSTIVQSSAITQVTEDVRPGGMKTVEIPFSKVSTSATHELLKTTIPEVPQESHYELLTRLRVASALTTSLATRREILAARILAITNLAYIHPEVVFQQKVLQQDSDEPRRLQLAYQLAELVHPPGDRDASVPRWLQTLALGGLEALAKHKTKAPDVCSALSVNVTHGVLLYVIRKAVAEMRIENNDEEDEDEWREALFSLLSFLPSTARTGEALVSAGLIPILVEVLTIRTGKAERNHPKVLNFLDTFVYNVRDAFQSLANSKGLDAISDLVAFEVDSAFTKAVNDGGIPIEYRNQATDYDIPYFQQQTLRALFKFMHHMMSHSGGNFDRLLRNLIDSSQLLGGLRIVLRNAKVFGANVWSGAVNILSSFIHNEPTSYAVIAEAGLSKGLLEAVTCKEITVLEEDKKETGENANGIERGPSAIVEDTGEDGDGGASGSHSTADKSEPEQKVIPSRDPPLARGILPASDTIACIPQAFGAICLNSAGMKLFQASDALESFFELFESPEHVKCMDSESDLPGILGNSFDELVRHHPQLKSSVLSSVFAMVVRVGRLVRLRASERGVGTKLWVEGKDAKIQVSGGWNALAGMHNDLVENLEGEVVATVVRDEGGDVEMSDADAPIAPSHSGGVSASDRIATYEDVVDMEDEKDGPSVSVYLEVIAKFLGGFFTNASLCCAFIDMGGVEYILDFCVLRCLPYDFSNRPASQAIARVVHALVEQKPHLVIPSLLYRAQTEVDRLKPFVEHEGKIAYFAPLTIRETSGPVDWEETPLLAEDVKNNGTAYAKSLVTVLNLCHVLAESFSQPMFNHHRSSSTMFTQVNLTDMYQRLVEDLGKLHRSCVWEEILLEKHLPELWNEATRLEGFGLGSNEADNMMGLVNIDGEAQVGANANAPGGASAAEPATDPSARSESANGVSVPTVVEDKAAAIERDETTSHFKNVRTLRYLLSQVPSSITSFFQGLARSLVAKRTPESYQKQNAFVVADALGNSLLQQLVWREGMAPSATEQYPYWIVMLTSLSQLLVEGMFGSDKK
jgi:E3 ubiquitin-protein ligase HUWE1